MTALDLLTKSELRVAVLAVRGCSNREMADQLCVSINTIKTHVRRLLERFGAHNKAHVVAVLMMDEQFRELVTSPARPRELANY